NFPGAESGKEKNHQQISVIRLITRLIFIWFLKEKHIVDPELFQSESAKFLLRNFEENGEGSEYYQAILQNLFFATLNTERSAEKLGNRQFMVDNLSDHSENEYQFFKYANYFQDRDKWLFLVKEIPFLNGGLFECLDQGSHRLDGFWDSEDNDLRVPNVLFFGKERPIDLSEVTGNKQLKKQKVRGIFEIFQGYKFTIDENTPVEQEVALDPELLGKVFENLLAEYNPETETTARKKTGSFYTPREIVDYMVDEALLAYLMARLGSESSQGLVKLGSNQVQLFGDDYTRGQLSLHEPAKLSNYSGTAADLERDLRDLLAYNEVNPFVNCPDLCLQITNAIAEVRVLDPACGSGAFPMGILQKLVHVLNQVDPDNTFWLAEQKNAEIAPVLADIEQAKKISYEAAREEAIAKLQERLAEIEAKFGRESQNYPRKLFLIERCIFGVDIQAIAVQIAKLRFFIALIVEQGITESEPNRGIMPLPNLETKFVAANTLIGITQSQTLRRPEVFEKEKALKEVRQEHFLAQTPMRKQVCRARDAQLRSEILALLRGTGLDGALVDTLASWNPYDQNASARFFDAEWMFGMTEGFDVVIGNPPYINFKMYSSKDRELYKIIYKQIFDGKADLFYYFIVAGINFLKKSGILSYIISRYWLEAEFASKLRQYVSQNVKITEIIDFENTTIFEGQGIKTSILSLKNMKINKSNFLYRMCLDNPNLSTMDYENYKNIEIEQFHLMFDNRWRLCSETSGNLLDKIK
ncbi:MAG: Eco57I restriction-modification methylase domain-containing protein, partial [Microcystaceae cyanobacterium]